MSPGGLFRGQQIRSRHRRPPELYRASYYNVVGPFDPPRHHQALFAFQTSRTIRYGFPSIITMLKSQYQCCRGQVTRRHYLSDFYFDPRLPWPSIAID